MSMRLLAITVKLSPQAFADITNGTCIKGMEIECDTALELANIGVGLFSARIGC